jgi:hypothetical protein
MSLGSRQSARALSFGQMSIASRIFDAREHCLNRFSVKTFFDRETKIKFTIILSSFATISNLKPLAGRKGADVNNV